MTDHVHSFYPVYIGITWELECLNCPTRITLETANARLNATERLRAFVAELMENARDGPNEMGGPFVALSVIANILEGKGV